MGKERLAMTITMIRTYADGGKHQQNKSCYVPETHGRRNSNSSIRVRRVY